jgi:hypothetical protein
MRKRFMNPGLKLYPHSSHTSTAEVNRVPVDVAAALVARLFPESEVLR